MSSVVWLVDIVKDVQEEVNKSYDTHPWKEIMFQAQSIIDELNWLWVSWKQFGTFTIDELTRMSGTLAVLRASLNDLREEAYRQTKIARSALYLRRNSIRDLVKKNVNDLHKTNGWKTPSVEDISTVIDAQTVRADLLLDFHENFYQKVQWLWYSIPAILTAIETRISYLKGDTSTASYYWESWMTQPASISLLQDWDDRTPALTEMK